MKYIVGSLIISFGILIVGLIIMIALQIKAPPEFLKYLITAWLLLTIFSYPLARKIIR